MFGTAVANEGVPLRVDNGIEFAWDLLEPRRIDPGKVLQIYSDWSATQSDVDFIKSHFPQAEFVYRNRRPQQDSEWSEALEKAARAMFQEALQTGDLAPDDFSYFMSGLENGSSDPMTSFNQDTTAGARVPGQSAPVLLPHLRGENPDNLLTQAMVGKPYLGIGLQVVLANVEFTPRGTIGSNYLMKAEVAPAQIDHLFETAIQNLRAGLQVSSQTAPDESQVFVLQNEYGLGSSAFCLPEIFQSAQQWTQSERVQFGIPEERVLLVSATGTQAEAIVFEKCMTIPYQIGQPLTPACFVYQNNTIQCIAKHPSSA